MSDTETGEEEKTRKALRAEDPSNAIALNTPMNINQQLAELKSAQGNVATVCQALCYRFCMDDESMKDFDVHFRGSSTTPDADNRIRPMFRAIRKQLGVRNSPGFELDTWACERCNSLTTCPGRCICDASLPVFGLINRPLERSALSVDWLPSMLKQVTAVLETRSKHKQLQDTMSNIPLLWTILLRTFEHSSIAKAMRVFGTRHHLELESFDIAKTENCQVRDALTYIQYQFSRRIKRNVSEKCSTGTRYKFIQCTQMFAADDFFGYTPNQSNDGIFFMHQAYCAHCGYFMTDKDKGAVDARVQKLLNAHYSKVKAFTGVSAKLVSATAGHTMVPCDPFESQLTSDLMKLMENCIQCRKPWEQCVPWYEGFTDALVWSDIAERSGLSIITVDCEWLTVERLLKGVKRIRPYPYREPGAIKDSNFVQLCYLVTHIIFIATDWCEFTIASHQRQWFVYEYVFIRSMMNEMIKAEDVELVGEFCACLRLLGESPATCASLRAGVSFLWEFATDGRLIQFISTADTEKGLHGLFAWILGSMDHTLATREADKKWCMLE